MVYLLHTTMILVKPAYCFPYEHCEHFKDECIYCPSFTVLRAQPSADEIRYHGQMLMESFGESKLTKFGIMYDFSL